LGPKTHFRRGRHENNEKRLFYFGLRILLQIQCQFLDIRKSKISKILTIPTVESDKTMPLQLATLQIATLQLATLQLVTLQLATLQLATISSFQFATLATRHPVNSPL
jgi:hypothetical protein